jgi:hypothetical protein
MELHKILSLLVKMTSVEFLSETYQDILKKGKGLCPHKTFVHLL